MHKVLSQTNSYRDENEKQYKFRNYSKDRSRSFSPGSSGGEEVMSRNSVLNEVFSTDDIPNFQEKYASNNFIKKMKISKKHLSRLK